MATYNGEQYLAQQLASLASQSRLPDEIVVCDDGSTDATVEIASAFAREQPNIEIRVVRNQVRLGYAGNFMKAMRACTGDLLFLCDQDDVWFESKIETVCGQFDRTPSAWLVVNDGELTDANLQVTGLTIAKQLGCVGLSASENLYGCCMTLRAELFKVADSVPSHLTGHDGWLNIIANSLDVRISIDLTLQYYRRHESNTSSWLTTDLNKISKWKLFKYQITQRRAVSPVQASERRLETLCALEIRLIRDFDYLKVTLPDPASVGRALADVRQKIKLNQSRLEFQSLGRLARLVASTDFALRGNYRVFEGWKSWVRDVVG